MASSAIARFWTPWLRELRAADRAFVAVDLEPVFGSIDRYVQTIDAAIVRVTAATGQPPLLICHSMGGLAARAWLRDADGARVHRIVTLGTPHRGTWLARFGRTANGRQMRMGGEWLQRIDGERTSVRQVPFTLLVLQQRQHRFSDLGGRPCRAPTTGSPPAAATWSWRSTPPVRREVWPCSTLLEPAVHHALELAAGLRRCSHWSTHALNGDVAARQQPGHLAVLQRLVGIDRAQARAAASAASMRLGRLGDHHVGVALQDLVEDRHVVVVR